MTAGPEILHSKIQFVVLILTQVSTPTVTPGCVTSARNTEHTRTELSEEGFQLVEQIQ